MQKIALISDIHGNIDALEAVLRDARSCGVDRYLFLGDYIFDMPFAADVLRVIRALPNADFVKGNKEGYLDGLSREDQSKWTSEQMGVIYQTYRELSEDDRAWLMALPETVTIALPSGRRIRAGHYRPGAGAGRSTIYDSSYRYNKEMRRRPFTHAEYLAGFGAFYEDTMGDICEGIEAEVIAYGHNHLQGFGSCRGRLVVDAGSCGISLDGRADAAYTILTDGRYGVEIEERRVRYDIDAAIARAQDTTISRAGWIWSQLVFRTLRESFDYMATFFEIANGVARDRGDSGRPYSNDTLHEAYDLFCQRYGGQAVN